MLATEYLANQPFTIIEAANGLEALESLKEHRFALILMDMKKQIL